MVIIGITGTIGAGKGTVVEYLVQKKNFVHYSVREFLTEEINKRNLPLNRDSMVLVANELRDKNSPSYIIDCLYERAREVGKNAVIESIRNVGEITSLRQKGNFCLLAVDAVPKMRYRRILRRNSETDEISFEKFMEDDQREMSAADPTKQDIGRCINMANYILHNHSSINNLYDRLEMILRDVLLNK